MNWNVARGLAAWLVLSTLGAFVVLIPDDGERIISLSEGHGPSLLDAVGIVLILVGWVAFLVPMFRSRALIEHRWALGLPAVVGSVVVVWSVTTDSGSWWMLGAAVLVAVQVVAAATIISRERSARRK